MSPADKFKESIARVEALSTTPQILAKVGTMLQDPDVNLEELSELIRNDGPLTADILRASNSASYAPAIPHTHPLSAMTALGMKEVKKLIELSLARQLLARDLVRYGITADEYWQASVLTALVMEALTKRFEIKAPDAYTIGILHSIGRLLIEQILSEMGEIEPWDGVTSIQDWERETAGVDFAEAGGLLLRHWKFPEILCETICNQLDTEHGSDGKSLLGMLQFSLRILPTVKIVEDELTFETDEDDTYLEDNGLTQEEFGDLLIDSLSKLEEIKSMLASS